MLCAWHSVHSYLRSNQTSVAAHMGVAAAEVPTDSISVLMPTSRNRPQRRMNWVVPGDDGPQRTRISLVFSDFPRGSGSPLPFATCIAESPLGAAQRLPQHLVR